MSLETTCKCQKTLFCCLQSHFAKMLLKDLGGVSARINEN